MTEMSPDLADQQRASASGSEARPDYLSPHQMDDLLVHVMQADKDQEIYPVRLTLHGGSGFTGSLNLHGLGAPPRGDGAQLAEYGFGLFSRLFAPPLDAAFQQAWGAARQRRRGLRIRLWLDSSSQQLHEIPWELLHYNTSGTGAQPLPLATDERVAFSRYLTSSERWGQPIDYRPLRMAIIVSAPGDLAESWPDLVPIDKAAEQQELEAPLWPMRNVGQLTYTMLPRAAPDDLHAALEDDYDVLLYFGHALHHPRRGTRLVLEHPESGEAELYDGAELVRRLKQTSTRPSLIVFVACNTAAQQHTAAQNGRRVLSSAPASLAAQIVHTGGVPAVLAMQNLVDIRIAREFSYHLSEYLLRVGVIDVAVSSVRQRVYHDERIDWATPVLYMHSRDGRLFAPNARLEYVQAILNDHDYARWQGPEFIRMDAITVPQGQPWRIFLFRPDDAPPRNDALTALRRALCLDQTNPETTMIALLGQPRSGQTTLLQRLTWELAQQARNDMRPDVPIAIYISLAGYEQQRGSDRLQQMIISAVNAVSPALASDVQRLFRASDSIGPRLSTTPRFIFFLDGLDAIPPGYRSEACAAIVALFKRLPSERVVISSVQDVFPTPLFHPITVLLIQPLDERQVRNYLRQRNPDHAALLYRRLTENRLIDLVTDPGLFTYIYERLESRQDAVLTPNQILSDLLANSLSRVPPRFTQGNAALRTLNALAWEFRWQYSSTLPLDDVFAMMARERRDRDYDLEDMYEKFRDVGLLTDVGQHRVRFVHPRLLSYCAASALYARPDFQTRFDEIIAMCSIGQRMHWWEDTIYALTGMLDDAAPLRPLVQAAFLDQNSTHALLLARCLQALSPAAEQGISDDLGQQLLDICASRLRPDTEPSIERRAQIASALGDLKYPRVLNELERLLTQRVRETHFGPRYEYSQVRIAAARALRRVLTRTTNAQPVAPPAEANQPAAPERATASNDATLQVVAQLEPSASSNLAEAATPTPALPEERPLAALSLTQLEQLDRRLQHLFQAWINATEGSPELRDAGRAHLRSMVLSSSDSSTPLERAVAAFALGDLGTLADAELLFAMIVRPPPAEVHHEEWNETIWAAADALTLFDAERVAELLAHFFQQQAAPPQRTRQPLAYLVGRVRTYDEAVMRWLVKLLLYDRDHFVKARALQSLAWLSRDLQTLDWLGNLIPSIAWLEEVLPSLDLSTFKERTSSMDVVVLEVVEAIAIWDTAVLNRMGVFAAAADDPSEIMRPLSPATLHLRLQAIEALALIGNPGTLTKIYPLVPDWPLKLRMAWHISASAIEVRPVKKTTEALPEIR